MIKTPKEIAKKKFPAELDKLYEMMEFALAVAKELCFSKRNFSKLELSLEEALVNIITYGYLEEEGFITIICELRSSGAFAVILEDEGIVFNPIDREHKLPIPTDGSQRGGYGIYFIVELMDEVLYERVFNKNRLILIKHPLN